jgi:nucleotide-binding universal stress UspA family protein
LISLDAELIFIIERFTSKFGNCLFSINGETILFIHILVPLDGSLLAERVIPHAMHFAQVFGSKITLLQVLDPSPFHESQSTVEPLNWQIRKAEVEMYLQGMAANIRESGIAAEYAIREGTGPEKIVDFAHAENVDLVVLGSHGASGLSRWNISSVVSKVIDKIYLPVLLVRVYQQIVESTPVLDSKVSEETSTEQGMTVEDPYSARAVSDFRGNTLALSLSFYQRILLPIDSSRRAECALPAATSLARSNQTDQVTVIMGAVVGPPSLPIPAPYPEEILQLIDRFMRISRSAVESYLGDLSQRIEGKCEIRIVENSNIAAGLHELAEKENVDLVVLCAHGQTGGTNYPYGSVARNYLEYGSKTVLVIQDVPLSQVRPTPAEIAAEKYGRR